MSKTKFVDFKAVKRKVKNISHPTKLINCSPGRRSSVKWFEGRREGYAVTVTVNGRPLNPRLDLWNHNPNGFEWGYGGSGPAQLALALLANHLSDDNLALALYQSFKWAVVARLPKLGWTLCSCDIDHALQRHRAGNRSYVCKRRQSGEQTSL